MVANQPLIHALQNVTEKKTFHRSGFLNGRCPKQDLNYLSHATGAPSHHLFTRDSWRKTSA